MTYATTQDLVDRFSQAELLELTDFDGNGSIDQAVVDQALADAAQIINSYVGARYDLPLAETPALLTALAADIARYRLYKDDPTEVVQENHKAALRQLKDIAEGRAVLDIGGSEPAPAEASVEVASRDRLFSRDTLKGY